MIKARKSFGFSSYNKAKDEESSEENKNNASSKTPFPI